MKKIIRKGAVLLVLFVVVVAGSALLMNSQSTDNRSDMNDATLPEVMVKIGSTQANKMYGYKQVMQTDFMRGSITPLDTTKKLTFEINPYSDSVTGLAYEVRTSDGSKVMENRKIKNLTKEENGYLSAEIEIGSDLRMNQEYSMQITLDTSEGEVYYYTRVVSRSQLNTESYLQFVKDFSTKCLDKEQADTLTGYLEAEDTSGGTNFNNITINSGLSNISWGSLSPKLYMEGVPLIDDINETTASITLEYQISAEDDEGKTEIYDVTEFYRMRYTETRIMLLDFRRSASKVFNPSQTVVSDAGILLGVRDKNVTYSTNDDGTIVAFEQGGDLWSYAPAGGKITRIFSFRKEKNNDSRYVRKEHDIKIIRVSDNGDVDFVLYGYMNRGSHEGYEGIAVYHYNRDKNVAEERAFIPVSESFEFLKKDLEKLSYVNEKNELFLILAKNLYRINIEENSSEILEKGIKNANFVSSDNNDHAAWLVSEGDEKGNIKEIDFDTCKTRLIAPQKGQRLRTVGFMNEDLIYGMLNKEDILTDEEEHKSVGIRILRIEDFEGNVKKEYRKDGLYITDISVGNTLIEFELSAKSGETSYVAQKKDTIMNNKKAAANTVKIELISASRTGVRVKLVFNTTKQTDSPLTMYAKVSSSDRKDIVLDTQIPQETAYYVYGQGGLNGIYTDPAKAVLRADTLGGVVLNRTQQYVWERGNKKTKMQIDTEGIPEIVLQGTYDIKTLKKSLKKTGTVIDLSGCSLDSVLYEISAQRPVIAKTGADTSVVIVGYDEYNTWLYDPVKKETYPYGMNDSTDLFQKAGNVFITYIETVNY